MVFFVCSACGSSLKKNQVEKHYYTRCGRIRCVSCMDCGQEFGGETYKQHTKCITEDEKYGGSMYKPKELKGEKKQEEWLTLIQKKVDESTDIKPAHKAVLNHIFGLSNIPRKKAKFQNFLMNSTSIREPRLLDCVWNVFKEALDAMKINNNNSDGETDQPDIDKKEITQPARKDKKSKTNTADNNTPTSKSDEGQKPTPDKDSAGPERQLAPDTSNDNKNKVGGEKALWETDKEPAEDEDRGSSKRKKKGKGKNRNKQMATDEVEEDAREEGWKKKGKKRKQREQTDDTGSEIQAEASRKEPKKMKKQSFDADTAMDADPSHGETKEKKPKHPNDPDTSLEPNPNHAEVNDGSDEFGSSQPTKFKWKVAITRVLEEGPHEGMKLNRLRKKVLSLYHASSNSSKSKTEKELSTIFTKKLKTRNDKYVLVGDKVKLRCY